MAVRVALPVLAMLLPLAACAPTSDQLLRQATACGEGAECRQLWDDWNDSVETADENHAKSRNGCPLGTVMVETDTDRGCSAFGTSNRL